MLMNLNVMFNVIRFICFYKMQLNALKILSAILYNIKARWMLLILNVLTVTSGPAEKPTGTKYRFDIL